MKDKAAEFITPEEQAKHKRAVGADGETASCELLGKKGYEIAARNYRAGRGEIDIIARSERHIVFVEVKTRSSESFGAHGGHAHSGRGCGRPRQTAQHHCLRKAVS